MNTENLIPDRLILKSPAEVIKEFNDLLKKEGPEHHKMLKTVELRDIDSQINQNFQIVSVYENEEIISHPVHQEAMNPDGNYGNSKETLYGSQAFKVRKTYAVIAYPASQAWDLLEKAYDAAYAENEELKRVNKNNQITLNAVNSDKARAIESRKHYENLYEGSRHTIEEERKKNSKYEQDMVKLRKALGDLRMNEILDMKI